MGILSAIKSVYYKTLLSLWYRIIYIDVDDKLKLYAGKLNLKYKKDMKNNNAKALNCTCNLNKETTCLPNLSYKFNGNKVEDNYVLEIERKFGYKEF